MTRLRTRRTLRWSILLLGLVLALALAAKLVGHLPGLKGTPADAIARDVYDYLKDMALVFITVIAAYLANVFQKRSAFVSSLEAQWRDIVHAKSQLVTYFEKPYPSTDDWLAVLGGEVPFAPVRDVAEALSNPFVAEVGMRDVVDHPDRAGGLHMLASPVKIDGKRAPGVRAPKLGEQTARVLGE
jgi:crotonobetainyl-CoA:carnitine CoA-transferase CaiB-like acyl-CoA transferase